MPADQTAHLSHFKIKINGTNAAPDVMTAMLDCTVENSLHLPDVCSIRLHDAGFHWIDQDTFKAGTEIEVLGGDENQGELLSLFQGETTGLEMDLAAHGVPTLIIRCYDRSHRLQRGRQNRSFVQVTDSDIVSQVGSEAGFSVHADSTSQVHDWVFQNNQTNWEFLTERAARNGYRLYVENKQDLHFHKVKDEGDAVVSLTWGDDLRSFRPRVATAPQVDEVIVRGWDPKTKQAIVGHCSTPSGVPEVGTSTHGGPVANGAFGAAKMIVSDRPVHSQGEADDLARSICDDIGGQYLEAEGLCYGQPNMRPGKMVEIKNIGQKFRGKYLITSTVHTYSPSEGYTTLFSANGKKESTLLAMLEDDMGGSRAPLGGNIVVALVTDNKDEQNLGRVKVKYPHLTEDHTSYWARQAAPMAGSGRGFYFLPEVNDEVLVAFEHGDIRRPYILGALWNGVDNPPEGNSVAVTDGKVNHRIIQTRIGHTVLLDDTDDTGEMKMTTKSGHMLTLNDKDKHITAKTNDGHKIFLDDAGGKIVIIDKTGSNKITITSSDNSIKCECMGDFSVDAIGKVSIHGTAGVDIKSDSMMNLESQGPNTLKSSAIVTVQGTLVKIN